jgi:hypothetical protein
LYLWPEHVTQQQLSNVTAGGIACQIRQAHHAAMALHDHVIDLCAEDELQDSMSGSSDAADPSGSEQQHSDQQAEGSGEQQQLDEGSQQEEEDDEDAEEPSGSEAEDIDASSDPDARDHDDDGGDGSSSEAESEDEEEGMTELHR